MSDRALRAHVEALHACRKCPRMESAPVSGGPVRSKVMLVGQAPGVREPQLGRPFAWTAGKTLFRWFEEACGFGEDVFRASIYMAAVCRCFPGKHPKGSGDRVPDDEEIANCREYLEGQLDIIRPEFICCLGATAACPARAADASLSKLACGKARGEVIAIRGKVDAPDHLSGAAVVGDFLLVVSDEAKRPTAVEVLKKDGGSYEVSGKVRLPGGDDEGEE